MNTYNIKTHSTYTCYTNVYKGDVKVYVGDKLMTNTTTNICKSMPLNQLKNYNETNNAHFNSYGLPEKLRKHFRYDVKCPVQSAWADYYNSKK